MVMESGSEFTVMTPKAQVTKEEKNKLDFTQIKNFCVSKDTIMKAKRKPTEQEKIFTNHVNIQNILKIYNKR